MRVPPQRELGRVFTLFGPLMAVSSIQRSPMLAGLLLWLNPFGLGSPFAVFLVNVVIGAVLYPLSARVLCARGPWDRSVRLDPVAVLLLDRRPPEGVLGGLIRSGDGGWDWLSSAAIAAGLVILSVFALRQRRSPAPLLARSLFRVRSPSSRA